MAEIHDLIKEGIKISKRIQNIPFSDLLNATTPFEVYQLDLTNIHDLELLTEIQSSANNFLKYVDRTHQRFEGRRINEVGRRIEEVFVEELKKTKLKPIQLSASGYPDIKIVDNQNRVTFLESKAVSQDWKSSFRSFYYTSGKKIDSNGRHLLIAWDISNETGNYWKVNGWKLVDLANLIITTKLEFQSNNQKLYDPTLIIQESNKHS
ncbi:MAG TPA: hypothetical protein PK154_00930 [Methanoregulaceae archaeon]|nr:hypothetical protein [Methanoregulaceae archaeon]HPW09658.1 hypothetical protein [Methanoregulaceae archaeon]